MSKYPQDVIRARKGDDERIFDAKQWAYMKNTGATYGWEQILDEPEEIKALKAAQQEKITVIQEREMVNEDQEAAQEAAPEKPKRKNQWSK